MLVIRMQRTGRKGHAQFRVVVQDSRRTPTSGKVVAALGHFNPHTKETTLDKEKAAFYLEHGAQPSERVVRLLKSEGVKLPAWVVAADQKAGKLRNPDKLRRNRPAEEAAPEEPAAEAEVETPAVEEAPTEEVAATEEAPAAEEAPAEA
jgi:small subunit ribosomal protein S16